MPLWECALWGLFGGAAVEGLEWAAAMRRTGSWPWGRRRKARAPFLLSVVIRLGVGAGLAAAVGGSGPATTLSMVGIGAAAPLILEKIAQQVPVAITQAEVEPSLAGSPAPSSVPALPVQPGRREPEVTDAP